MCVCKWEREWERYRDRDRDKKGEIKQKTFKLCRKAMCQNISAARIRCLIYVIKFSIFHIFVINMCYLYNQENTITNYLIYQPARHKIFKEYITFKNYGCVCFIGILFFFVSLWLSIYSILFLQRIYITLRRKAEVNLKKTKHKDSIPLF